MERLHYRSTSLVDLQAELHQQDLVRELRGRAEKARPEPRRRALAFGLSLLRRRIPG